MRQRGRRSGDAIDQHHVVEGQFGKRPEPPAELDQDEAAIWREIVASEAADFFGTAAVRAMLKDYCRHRVAGDRISVVIRLFKADWLKSQDGAKRFHGLLKMRDLEGRAAADKATKLRLTNQARYTPQAAGTAARNAPKGKMPWET